MGVISSVSGILIEGNIFVGHNIIELNGKKYDALTGSFLGASTTSVTKKTPTATGHRGRFIDGFVKTAKQVSTNTTQPAPFIPVKPHPAKTKAAKPKTQVKHIAAHQPEHAKTLMRSAVSKPNIQKKPIIKTQAPAEVMVKPAHAIVPKLSATHIDPRRLAHAKDTQQSETIQKFTPAQRQSTPMPRAQVASAPVRARAAQPARPHAAPQHVAVKTSAPVSKPIQKEEDIFEKALARATSHEQPKPARALKKQRNHRRLVNVLAGFAAVLVIGGFVAYLNAPNIELRIASIRAGFHAALPAYQPVGYAMNRNVQLHNNQVTISFHSDNGSSFKLTQQPSNWDSSTLYDNVVAATNKSHQTIESNGRTIYLFGDTNAAWVNNGVLYQISGQAELSNSQISQLAASI